MKLGNRFVTFVFGGLLLFVLFFPSIRRLCFSVSVDSFVKSAESSNSAVPLRGASPVKHLACIMDGNRRWARERNLSDIQGHEKGAEVCKSVIEYALAHGIERLSVFSFSTENFNRTESEKSALFGMVAKMVSRYEPFLCENSVRVRVIGDPALFPESTRPAIKRIEAVTASNNRLHLDILFCYGSQQEIVAAAKAVAQKVKNNEISVDQIDEKLFASTLWTGDVKPPDLVIRTGKRNRISNFLLFQIAYSEIKYLDCYWPDLTSELLDACIAEFGSTVRTFGV